MTTLRIHESRNGVLALDFRDLIDLLAPRSLEANWIVSPVRASCGDVRVAPAPVRSIPIERI